MKQPPRISVYRRRWLVIAAAMLFTASLGWWVGIRSRTIQGTRDAPTSITSNTALPATAPHTPTDPAAKAQSWLDEIKCESSPLAQAAAAARLVDRLPPDDWPALLTHLNKFPRSLVRPVLAAAIERRWAEADPAGAAAWGLKSHPALAAAAAAAWIRQDRTVATAWFETLTSVQRESGKLMGEFYSALLLADYPAALQSIKVHENDERFGFALGWAERDLVNSDPDRALKFTEQLTNSKLKQSLRDNVALAFAKTDPLKALAWAKEQPDSETMVLQIFKHSDGSSPIGRYPALASLPPEEQKRVLAKTWPWWEHGDAFANFKALRNPPPGLTDESRKYLQTRTREVLLKSWDPPEIARRLQSGWEDLTGLWEVPLAEMWSSRDPDQARAWIEQLPESALKEKARLAHIKAREEALAMNQPKDAVATAMESLARNVEFPMPPGLTVRFLSPLDEAARQSIPGHIAKLPEDRRAQALTSFMNFQASNYPEEAAAWLHNQPPSREKTEQASRLAANWVLDDAAAAAGWATSLPEGGGKTWALWNLARQWQRADEKAVRDWAARQSDTDRAILESAFAGRRPE